MSTLITFQLASHNPENIFFNLKFIQIPNKNCGKVYLEGIGLRNICCFVHTVQNKLIAYTHLKPEDTSLDTQIY